MTSSPTSEASTSQPTRVSAPAPGSPELKQPHRHSTTTRKIQAWSLVTRKKTIILGDSNLSRIPSFSHPNLQIDSFPGAKFHHITAILLKLAPCHNTTQVIISIGLNNGLSETSLTTSTKQLQAMWKQTTTTFPNATIYIHIINFSDRLKPKQQTLLTAINNTIALKYNFIPEINPLLFRVNDDDIHWTTETAEMLLRYWKEQFNLEAPRISEVGFICLPHIFNPFSKLGANLRRALQPTTKNAVYAVRCRACHKLYVGETRHEISLRIKQHLYRINSGYGTSVLYLHFKLHGPETLQSLGLESSRSWTTAQRRAAERRWNHRLKTIDPTGLNEKYQ
ncbi:hypothetical protein F7725_012139 [Dissostichus mawsoni]|uniref:GIY-YIG domain-containing protein n=1 Tax=Dissostichus mawsoni TaxID=36200 RepID=A0A7J5ZEY8_DISMA|nr:hypothetical protein F7725_012139 [Dissostichus mawsoni]